MGANEAMDRKQSSSGDGLKEQEFEVDDTQLVQAAYETLLRLPLAGMCRHRLNGTLAALREELVVLTGVDAETIQTQCEHNALKK